MEDAWEVITNQGGRTLPSRLVFALAPEPAPVLIRTGVAVLLDVIVVFAAVRGVLLMAGHPEGTITHAVLPAVFGGMFAFLGSLGGSARSGIARAAVLAGVAVPLTLVAI